MIPRLLLLWLMISFLATSKGQDCSPIESTDCTESFPKYDIVLPTDHRNICVPSVSDEDKEEINTLVLELAAPPSCAGVSKNSSAVPLCSASPTEPTLIIGTGELFRNNTETGELVLYVDNRAITVEYGPNGTHLLGATSRTVSQSDPFQFLVWRSYFAGPRTSKELCLVKSDGDLVDPVFLKLLVVGERLADLSCVTDVVLHEFVLEYNISRKDGKTADPGTYHLVIATHSSCHGAVAESPVFTLVVQGTTTVTPEPTPQPSPTGPSDKGVNVAAIVVGVTVPICIVILLVAVSLALILFRKWWWKRRQQKTGDINGSPAQEEYQMERRDSEIKESTPPPIVPKDKIVAVLDTVTGDLKLGKGLAEQEKGQLEEFKDHDVEENGMSYIRRTNVILNLERYIRLYITYRGSPEELRENHPQVWEVMKDVKTRHYGRNKVVFVQVTSRTVSEEGTEDEARLLDDYTVEIAENKLSNPQLASSVIYNKLKLRESHAKIHNVTPLWNEAHEQTDEGMPVHQSSEGSPRPGVRGTGDEPFLSLPSNPTSSPPSYASDQPAPLSLQQAGRVPIPSTAEEPMRSSGSQKELITEVKRLNLTQEQVLDELKKQREIHQKIAKSTGQTAENTEGLGEAVEEVRLAVGETNDVSKRGDISEEQPDLS